MAKQATKAKLLRDLRKSLRQFSTLYDAAHALNDPDGVKVVIDELKMQSSYIQQTANQLTQLAEIVFKENNNGALEKDQAARS